MAESLNTGWTEREIISLRAMINKRFTVGEIAHALNIESTNEVMLKVLSLSDFWQDRPNTGNTTNCGSEWSREKNFELETFLSKGISFDEICLKTGRTHNGIRLHLRDMIKSDIYSNDFFGYLCHYVDCSDLPIDLDYRKYVRYLSHDSMRALLMEDDGQNFVKLLTYSFYPECKKQKNYILEYHLFPEVSILSDGKSYSLANVVGKDEKPHRMDAVIVSRLYRKGDRDKVVSIGIELKGSLNDLEDNLPNIANYLGYTDYFYVGTPTSIIDDACLKAYELEKSVKPSIKGKIGVFDVQTGKIHKSAKHFTIKAKNRIYLYENLLCLEDVRDYRNKSLSTCFYRQE